MNKNYLTSKLILDNQLLQIKSKADPNNIILNSCAYQQQINKKYNIYGDLKNKVKSFKPIYQKYFKDNKLQNNCYSSNKNKDLESLNNNKKHKSSLLLPVYKIQNEFEIFKQKKQFYNNLNLAQKIGLEKIDKLPLDLEEWNKIESQTNERLYNRSICPICHERFSNKSTVVLSCSHVFHTDCFNSYEKLTNYDTSNKSKYCPVCRTSNYYKKSFNKAKYIQDLIIVIQKMFKGYIFRKKAYKLYFEDKLPNNKRLKKIYSYFKICQMFEGVSNKLNKINDSHNTFMKSIEGDIYNYNLKEKIIDKDIILNLNKLNSIKYANQNIIESNIKDIKKTIDCNNNKIICNNNNILLNKSKHELCAICMCKLGSKTVNALSCGHVYHIVCLNNMEKYDTYYTKRCPTCRNTNYQRYSISL